MNFVLKILFPIVWFAVGIALSGFGCSNSVSVIGGFMVSAVFITLMNGKANQIR